MANRFTNKVILITGGGSGIGLACAERFAQEGAQVVIAQRSPNTQFHTLQVDLLQSEDCQYSIAQTIKEYGQLDILINNAGMMQESSIEMMSLDAWQQTLALNLTAPFLLCKYALPELRKTQGNIVNIGSIEGLGANPQHAAYCASKAGLHGLTRAIAIDHGKEGIRCNAVAPGWIDTPLNENFIEAMPDPHAFRSSIGNIHPVGHTGKPQDVAALTAWLSSNEASFVTGQIYTIDGGRMAKLSLPN